MDLKSLFSIFCGADQKPNPVAFRTPDPNETPEQRHEREIMELKEDLSRKSMRLSTVLIRMKNLTRSLDRDEIFSSIVEITAKFLDADRVQLLRNDLEKRKFRIVRAEGMASKDFTAFEVPYDQASLISYLAHLSQTKRPEEISTLGIKACAEDPETSGFIGKGVLKTIIAAPIWVDNSLYGVINVERMRNPDYSQDELNMVIICADIAGLVLKNSQLYSEAKNDAIATKATCREQELAEKKLISSLSRIVSPEIADRIIQSPSELKLGTTSQLVTILFVNIRHFTELSEKIQPVRLSEQLNEFFSAMTKVIQEMDGMLDKFLGDGLMAIFGTPIARPNDAVRGVLCALKMREALNNLHSAWKKQGRPLFETGIGICTGEAAVGYIGSPDQLSYTAIGDPVNVAHLITAQAMPMQILVSGATQEQAKDFFEMEKKPTARTGGKSHPVKVFSVKGIKTGIDLEQLELMTRPISKEAKRNQEKEDNQSFHSVSSIPNIELDLNKLISCPNCGENNEPRAKFCNKCGMPVF